MKRTSAPEEETHSQARSGYGPFFGSADDLEGPSRRLHPVAGVLMLVGAVGALAFALLPHGSPTGIPASRVVKSVRPLLKINSLDVTLVGLGYGAAAGFGVLLLIAALLAFKSSARRRIAVRLAVCLGPRRGSGDAGDREPRDRVRRLLGLGRCPGSDSSTHRRCGWICPLLME